MFKAVPDVDSGNQLGFSGRAAITLTADPSLQSPT